MKKRIINIILIIVALISALGVTVTVILAYNNSKNDPSSFSAMEQSPPNANNQSSPASNNNQQPPNQPPTAPNNQTDINNPPSTPDDQTNTDNQQSTPGNQTDNQPTNSTPPTIPTNDFGPMTDHNQSRTITAPYIIAITIFSSLFAPSLLFLLMRLKNPQFYHNHDKLIIYILSNIILITGLTFSITTLANYLIFNQQPDPETSSRDQATLDKSNIATTKNINLSQQDTDILINTEGTYMFQGNFTHSIIVEAENQDVELILDNIEITNDQTAAIIGLAADQITINLADDSYNKLTDGGNSEYDGCIFSNAELIFTGNGTLEVNGLQNAGEGIATEAQNITFNDGTYIITSNDDGINAGGDGATITINDGTFYIDASGDGIDSNKDAVINGGTVFVIGSDVGGDAGIDTDAGYTINGGTIIALGSDMIETPQDSSTQKVLAITLETPVAKDTIMTLMKNNQALISFEAPKSFKTLIISNDKLQDGSYSLYSGGAHDGQLVYGIYQNGTYTKGDPISINSKNTFEISGTINIFGKGNTQKP